MSLGEYRDTPLAALDDAAAPSIASSWLAEPPQSALPGPRPVWTTAVPPWQRFLTSGLASQLSLACLSYYLAGTLGQMATSIRSGNIGPVWPAAGVALALVLKYGYRVWPGLALGAFLVALQSPVSAVTAAGQATGATCAAIVGGWLLRLVRNYDPALGRLRDALALVVTGAFASTLISATIGMSFIRLLEGPSYSRLSEAWLIYWLGDATGVLLVTPAVFGIPHLAAIRTRSQVAQLALLVTVLAAACLVIFGGLPFLAVSHVLAFTVLPLVIWAAIAFGIGGVSLSLLLIATSATFFTTLGLGPFGGDTAFERAALLDVLFTLLSVSGLTLTAVISERTTAQEERERLVRSQTSLEARLRLATIVESSQDPILSATVDGVILTWNGAAQRLFGYSGSEAIGRSVEMLVPMDRLEQERTVLRRLREGGAVENYESVAVTKYGEHLNVMVSVSSLLNAAGNVVGVARVMSDITRQKQADEAMSSLSRRLIEAQEQERARIARELHDDIGQRTALLTISLSRLADEADAGSLLRTHINELGRQASAIASGTQALSHRLHSPRLELLGLAGAMRHFCEEVAEQHRVNVDFKSQPLSRSLPMEVSQCLFRILQEGLHNAVKHSGNRSFDVRLWQTPMAVHLVVCDYGKGFEVQTARLGHGIGLLSMQERIKLVNGTLTIRSLPRQGTTLHARVPLERAAEPPSA